MLESVSAADSGPTLYFASDPLVGDFLGDVLMASALSTWEKSAPVIREARSRFGQPGMWSGFEFLADQFERSGLVKPLATTTPSRV